MNSIEAIGKAVCSSTTFNQLDCENPVMAYATVITTCIGAFGVAYATSSMWGLTSKSIQPHTSNLTDQRWAEVCEIIDSLEKRIIVAFPSPKALFHVAHELFGHCRKRTDLSVYEIRLLKVLFLASLAGMEVDPELIITLLRSGAKKLEKKHIQIASQSNSSKATPFPNGNPITISYGGGMHFLDQFLAKKHLGYAAENNNHGMFVSAYGSDRDILYATRRPIEHFDYPVTMTATIAPENLLRVNQNCYEAVLTPDAIDTLVGNISVQTYFKDREEIALQKSVLLEALQQNLPLSIDLSRVELSSKDCESIQQAYDALLDFMSVNNGNNALIGKHSEI